jgi:hypothetical protein
MSASPEVWDDARGWKESPPSAPCPSAASIRRKKQRWLWFGRLAAASSCILGGRGGAGKSTLAAAIAAHVTGGPTLTAHDGPRSRGGVLWFPAEENVAVQTVARLKAAGARTKKVFFPGLDGAGLTERVVEFPADLGEVEDVARRTGAVLAIVDPLASYVQGCDLNRQQDVRNLFQAFRLVSERTGISWLFLAHPSKVRTGPVLDRLFGSASLVHCARSVMILGGHPDGSAVRVLIHAKTNEGTLQTALQLDLPLRQGQHAPSVQWLGPCDVTLEQLGVEALDAGELDAHLDARELLKRILKDGPRAAKDVLAEATACGIGERTMRKAKAELRCPSVRVDSGYNPPHWDWGPLPPEGETP